MTTEKEKRIDIVVKEIEFWKRNNMLPEQYCNYLLLLYTEGENSVQMSETKDNNRAKFQRFIFPVILILISLFVIYFTELSIVLQTTILASFVGFLVGLAIYYSKKQLSPALLLVAIAFILLIVSVNVAEKVFSESPFVTYMALFLNSFIWVFTGLRLKLIYFTLSGSFGIILLIVFILK